MLIQYNRSEFKCQDLFSLPTVNEILMAAVDAVDNSVESSQRTLAIPSPPRHGATDTEPVTGSGSTLLGTNNGGAAAGARR